jgi:hypothetical protein
MWTVGFVSYGVIFDDATVQTCIFDSDVMSTEMMAERGRPPGAGCSLMRQRQNRLHQVLWSLSVTLD